MESDPIGISCCFFTITKKLLSSVIKIHIVTLQQIFSYGQITFFVIQISLQTIGLIVTYAIVVLQIPNEKAFWEEETRSTNIST